MQRTLASTLIPFCLLVMAVCPVVLGDRFSGVADEQVVFGDDFDNYCVDGETWLGYPPFPAACPTDGSAVADDTAYRSNWTRDAGCSQYPDNHLISTNPLGISSPPFSMLFRGEYDDAPVPTNLAASRHVFPLLPAIQAKDPTKDVINGTDAQPLKFSYRVNHFTNDDCDHCGGDIGNSIWYAELCLGDDRAPTDYILRTCPVNWSLATYPIICQQRQTINGCPPLSTNVHACFAVGMMALMDAEPCDVENGRLPTNYHLSIFDGVKWVDLRQNVYPGTGDFNVREGGEAVLYLEVRSSYYFVSWDVTWYGIPEHSEATIPRLYTGPFDRVASGTGPGCQLDAQGQCTGSRGCFDYCAGADKKSKWCWRHTFVDSMVLHGGVPTRTTGACCHDGTCGDLNEAECQAVQGVFHGYGTSCATTPCCPHPFADADGDDDVDQIDFALFQRCIGGTAAPIDVRCLCFNRDGDGDVDADDLLEFVHCATGPGISFAAAPPPSCTP